MDLMQGDCMELMRGIPDGSVDMVLCDLPYGVTARNKWDVVLPFDPLWQEWHRICKEDAAIVLNCQQPFTTDLVSSNRKEFKYMWYWDKHLKTNFMNAKIQPLRQVEEIAVFYRKQCTFHPPVTRVGRHLVNKSHDRLSSNYGEFRRKPPKMMQEYCATNLLTDYAKEVFIKGHPTQKPVKLLEFLIRTYTDEGQVILDCCMGSGSTGVACVNTGRGFIGMELDGEWFAVAKERIGDAERSLSGS